MKKIILVSASINNVIKIEDYANYVNTINTLTIYILITKLFFNKTLIKLN
jgi:hypothetical protein